MASLNEAGQRPLDSNRMTPAERQRPDILNGSRRARIAAGSGTTVQEVNGLVNRFTETRKLMQQMGRGGGLPGMPGMGGLPGMGRPAKQQAKKAKKKGRGVSGNPARRAGQEPAASGTPVPTNETDLQAAMADFQLPPELQKMLNQQNKG